MASELQAAGADVLWMITLEMIGFTGGTQTVPIDLPGCLDVSDPVAGQIPD